MKPALFLLAMVVSLNLFAQDTTFNELLGTYRFPAGSVIEEAVISVQSGVLSIKSTEAVSVLQRTKGDTFSVVSFQGIAVFKRNDAKKIIGVHVDAGGYVLDGIKEEADAEKKYSATMECRNLFNIHEYTVQRIPVSSTDVTKAKQAGRL